MPLAPGRRVEHCVAVVLCPVRSGGWLRHRHCSNGQCRWHEVSCRRGGRARRARPLDEVGVLRSAVRDRPGRPDARQRPICQV